jgi:hypothetical protein
LVYLAKQFQRRRLTCEKLTDDRWRMPSDRMRWSILLMLFIAWLGTS